MPKKIGIVGDTGRMGQTLQKLLTNHVSYCYGGGFHRGLSDSKALDKLFATNDIIIDFSNATVIKTLLLSALQNPKPLIICTTGWSAVELDHLLQRCSQNMPVIIAPNTSIGACLQHYLIKQLARKLDDAYDIDLIEKHHRNKIDHPSGTANRLIDAIQVIKQQQSAHTYQVHEIIDGKRPDYTIGLAVQRTGNLPGEHTVSFTSVDEQISIQHIAFDRKLFANGAIRIVDWITTFQPSPGQYSMDDVLCLGTFTT